MRKGFTLIELLIVIAIIAILALIAVPNFLEAQTRSKVSRVYSDMRTCSVGLQAYTVDWGRSIIGYNEGRDEFEPDLWTKEEAYVAWNLLTTPVAYLTSIPEDPFLRTEMKGAAVRVLYKRFTYNRDENQYLRSAGIMWQMYSPGPSMWADAPWLGSMVRYKHANNVYDSTNGTMSRGMIFWTNKGRFSGIGL